MITAEKAGKVMAAELEAVKFWERQAETSEATRREDLLEAYRHNVRAEVFADMLGKDFFKYPRDAVATIKANAGRLEDLLRS